MLSVIEKNEVVQFKDGDFILDVHVSPNQDTVWLTREQLSLLFDRNVKTIDKHIKNALNEELDNSVVSKFATTASDGKTYQVNYYNLDMIISIGYRVKSKRGILFRKWANRILKDYLLKGYVINDRHFQDIEYVTNILDQYKNTGGELPNSDSILEFLKSYQRGFKILDDYDHHTLDIPVGQKDTYIIQYDECIHLIHQTMFSNKEDYFALERDDSLKSSISTIYQSFSNQDFYPTLEDKASALLYFVVKNHSFIDGNKRIGATLFLYFLEKNNALIKNGKKRINNDTLVTLTILVAASKPEDKDIIIQLIKTIIK